MKTYNGIIFTAVFACQFFDCESKEYEIDLCRKSTGNISYSGQEKADDKWIIQQNDCSSDTSALLLRLSKMELKYDHWCYGTLKISAFDDTANICDYIENSCFFMASDGWRFNNSFISECALIYWISKQNIFPLKVTFVRDAWLSSFSIAYEYLHGTIPVATSNPMTLGQPETTRVLSVTTSNPTSSFQPETTSVRVNPAEHPTASHVSYNDKGREGSAVNTSAIIGLTIFVGIEAIALAILLFHGFKSSHESSERNKDVTSPTESSSEHGHRNLETIQNQSTLAPPIDNAM